MRLIDADALFPYGAVPYFEDDGFATADKLYGIVKNAPTVDAVEVVRCKDCKHFTAGYCCRDIKGRSQMHYMGEDAFCSYGERKE